MQLDYLRRTPQVRDVLLSGGDALTLAPKLLERSSQPARDPHIEIIRIGSRVPVFLPQRIDDELCDMLAEVPPAVDEPPLQPSQRDHARGLAAPATN
jgi:lysine 2,3-aminomutase